MTIHQFFIKRSQIDANQKVELAGPDVHHIRNVLRLKKGNNIRLIDEKGNLYLASVEKVTERSVRASVREPMGAETPRACLSIVQGIPRLPKADFITQKLTELGVTNIVFVPTDYTAYPDSFDRICERLPRLCKIAAAAAKQCGRRDIPNVLGVKNLEEAAKSQKSGDMLLVASEKMKESNFRDVLSSANKARSLTIFIGPEGGFSDDEMRLLERIGASCFSLGRNILRTETAALVATAIILYELGEI